MYKVLFTMLLIAIIDFRGLSQGSVTLAQPPISIKEVASPDDIRSNRYRGNRMLQEIKGVLKSRYYDKNFHGIDVDARFKAAAEKIKSSQTNSEIFLTIAGLLIEFDDSHTRFYPPNRTNQVDYGFSMQMVGANCFVTNVKRKSDAEAKGLRAGDRIVSIGPTVVKRENLWIVNYLIYSLIPQPSIQLSVVGIDGAERKINAIARVTSLEQRLKAAEKRRKDKPKDRQHCHELDSSLVVCRLETFSVERKQIDSMMAVATRYGKMVLDLRGNRGGLVEIEEYLTGHFFDRAVKIADLVTRDKKLERIASPRKERGFKGELIVLIDSNSASAAEVFARVIQLEKRGKIVGDVSAGAVMTSNGLTLGDVRGVSGFEKIFAFGMSVTVADLIMSDGQRLEKIGVFPDHPVGPSPLAILNRTDPILAYAADLLKVQITPEAAGKLNLLSGTFEDDDDETDEGKDN
jgi:C-terminal processing protease CtpA/Prc